MEAESDKKGQILPSKIEVSMDGKAHRVLEEVLEHIGREVIEKARMKRQAKKREMVLRRCRNSE